MDKKNDIEIINNIIKFADNILESWEHSFIHALSDWCNEGYHLTKGQREAIYQMQDKYL